MTIKGDFQISISQFWCDKNFRNCKMDLHPLSDS